MRSFFSKLFGSDTAIEKTIDTVSNGLDKLYYSDEEKAEDAMKDRSEARQMIVQWMAATSGQNLARRLIALSIVGVWLGMYVSASIGSMVAVWVEGRDKWLETSNLLFEFANGLNDAVMLIIAFYFCAPYMGTFANGIMERMAGKGKK